MARRTEGGMNVKPLKLFVSMPMNGKTEQEIAEHMQQAHKDAERITHTPLVLLDTVFDLPEDAKPLDYIGESIKKLAEADVAYFCDGWEQARGCRIEWMCARDYGVDRIVYVSCKPTSLARDLVTLQARGYKVEKVCCVDMFPETVHVETVVELVRIR